MSLASARWRKPNDAEQSPHLETDAESRLRGLVSRSARTVCAWQPFSIVFGVPHAAGWQCTQDPWVNRSPSGACALRLVTSGRRKKAGVGQAR
jgi:hypothetical protein